MALRLDTSYEERDEYLFVRAAGDWTTEGVKQLVDEIADEANARGYNRILLDILALSAPKSDMHRYVIGEYAATRWRRPNLLKVACVYRPELITKFAENTAVNRGGHICVESTVEAALDWLLNSARR